MKKTKILGIIISLSGLFMMGFEAGRNDKYDTNNTSLTLSGLFIVFVGLFITMYLSKKKNSK